MGTKVSREELLSNDSVRQSIAERAYLKAEREGFIHGRDVQHWLEAETEMLQEFLSDGASPSLDGAASSNGTKTKRTAATKKTATEKPAAKATTTKAVPRKKKADA